MNSINILAADDYFYGIDLARALTYELSKTKVEIEFHCSNYIKKEYLQKAIEDGKAKSGTKSIEELIEDLEHIDICFLDIVWYKEIEVERNIQNSNKGAKIVAKMVKEKHPDCLIILLTHQAGRTMRFQKYELDDEEEYYFISKMISEEREVESQFSNLSDKQIEFLFKILEQWQNHYIKFKYSLPKLNLIKNFFINNKGKTGCFEINNSMFFQNVSFKGTIYFKINALIELVESSLKFTHPKNIGFWANKKHLDLVEIYKKHLEIDKQSGNKIAINIDDKATAILKNRINYLKDKREIKEFNEIKISAINVNHYKKTIPNSFYSLLIWRKVFLGICRIADETYQYDWKKYNILMELYYGHKGFSYDSTKVKFFFLGFGMADQYIRNSSLAPNNCFPEENEWRKNLKINSFI
jgi:hypothetical protein